MKTFIELKKNLKKDFGDLPKLRIALLGDSSTQFLKIALKGQGYENGFDLDIFEADFSQIERQVFDLSSDLYDFKPEFVIIYHSTNTLLQQYNKLEHTQKIILSNERLVLVDTLFNNLKENLEAKVLYFNYNEIDDSIFGNYANKTEHSFLFQLRKLNFELMQYSQNQSDFHLIDLSTIQNLLGKNNFYQSQLYINAEVTINLDALPHVSYKIMKLIEALKSKIKKCLILDLDNTTWGGVIGDDGIDNIEVGNLGIGKAFVDFQHWVKKLKERGVIIAVCSKNTESIAKEPFEKHPDMVLKMDDISVFVANWENKADNIRYIQKVLNIGFDSMVFLDDNPFERNIVRENLPEVCVPELPEDPAEYLEFLYTLNLFETISYSEADSYRTKQYQIEAKRVSIQKQFTNEDDFLKSLGMVSTILPFDTFNTPRVSQLSQRSNQFNLRSIRYSELEIERITKSEDFKTFTFTLEDKFGDNGLICVVILEKKENKRLFIDTWFMSCRVLKRGMEEFVLNTIVNFAVENDFSEIVGEYIPTSKNAIVEDHYKKLGFHKKEDFWFLEVPKQNNSKKCHIKIN